ncbi:hypothetical protein [Burkholderia sp. PU8-34]
MDRIARTTGSNPVSASKLARGYVFAPNKWSPLIMSFQKFYVLASRQVHASRLAEIPEHLYRSPDVDRARRRIASGGGAAMTAALRGWVGGVALTDARHDSPGAPRVRSDKIRPAMPFIEPTECFQ